MQTGKVRTKRKRTTMPVNSSDAGKIEDLPNRKSLENVQGLITYFSIETYFSKCWLRF